MKTFDLSHQPYRRVSFHLQKLVDSELMQMLDNDIIEKAHGPNEWLSPIVTPIKPGDPTKARICVDNRRVNQAILRDRHPIPTVEQLIHDLNGSVIF